MAVDHIYSRNADNVKAAAWKGVANLYTVRATVSQVRDAAT